MGLRDFGDEDKFDRQLLLSSNCILKVKPCSLPVTAERMIGQVNIR